MDRVFPVRVVELTDDENFGATLRRNQPQLHYPTAYTVPYVWASLIIHSSSQSQAEMPNANHVSTFFLLERMYLCIRLGIGE